MNRLVTNLKEGNLHMITFPDSQQNKCGFHMIADDRGLQIAKKFCERCDPAIMLQFQGEERIKGQ